jgi:hypothetical protein
MPINTIGVDFVAHCSASCFVSCSGGHLACDATIELRNVRPFHQCFCGHAAPCEGVDTGKEAVSSLVERGGKVRSHHVPAVTPNNLRTIAEGQIHGDTYVMTAKAEPPRRSEASSSFMVPSITALVNMCEATYTRTRLRATSPSLSPCQPTAPETISCGVRLPIQ